MLYMQDRPRIPVRPPRVLGPDEYLLGRLTPKELAERCAREPYRTTWRRLRALARKAARANPAAPHMPEHVRARYVLALAVSAWMTGSATHRRRAEDALLAAGRGAWSSWCAAPEAIQRYLVAMDLLRAGGEIRDERIPIELIGQFVAGGVAVNDQLPKNNWQVCALSAIGMTALAWWHRATPWPVREWYEIALDGLSRLLYGLVSPDGAYLEGPGYSRRSSVAFLPFAWAVTLCTGVDLINFPAVARWMRWVAETALPDGTNPPIDDTRREKIHPWALLCHPHCRQAGLFRWAFERMDGFDPDWEEFGLFLHDDAIRPTPPASPPSAVLRHSGIARFRSDWSPNATYGLLVCRPQPPLGPGHADSAHRHEDPTHFLLYAHGELLTLDAGYGGYGHPERYRWILNGEAHNLILVDGLGPPRQTFFKAGRLGPNVSTAHGRVRPLFASDDLFIAEAQTTYFQVDFTRWMAFVRGRYFVVLDLVESAAPHAYSWVLHGAGRLTRLEARRALWRVRRAQLDARWLLPTEMDLTRHRGRHYTSPQAQGQGEEHDYVKATAHGKSLCFVTVLLPGRRGEPPARVEPLGIEGHGFGVSVRQGDGAEHFAFDPWRRGAAVLLPRGRRARPQPIKGTWAVWFETPAGVHRATEARR